MPTSIGSLAAVFEASLQILWKINGSKDHTLNPALYRFQRKLGIKNKAY
jgi:hypothetical protein